MGSIVGIWSLIDQRDAARASERRAEKAMFASAAATGRAEAREAAERQAARSGQSKEAENLSLEDANKQLSRKKRGVQSSYTAQSAGSGGGMMKGTSLTPIGGGDTGAIAGT